MWVFIAVQLFVSVVLCYLLVVLYISTDDFSWSVLLAFCLAVGYWSFV